jgi:hypothetical protein
MTEQNGVALVSRCPRQARRAGAATFRLSRWRGRLSLPHKADTDEKGIPAKPFGCASRICERQILGMHTRKV